MVEFRFGLLYGVCLAGCLTVVSALRAHAEPPAAEILPQKVEQFIAVPPKPDGASEERGEGEAPLHTWEGCQDRGGDFRDACFKALAWQRAERDVDGALKSCEEVEDVDQRFECVADVAELHSLTDRKRSEGICPTIPRRSGKINVGLGLLWPGARRTEYARAVAQCGNVARLQHDVNGGSLRWTRRMRLIGTNWKRRCVKDCFLIWASTGNPKQPRALQASSCSISLPEAAFTVLAGRWRKIGEDETVGFCRDLPEHQDSCFLGLSAHAKRLSPEERWSIARPSSDDLRERCSAFAQR